MHSDQKIVSLDSLLAARAEARAAGKTVVHCHGCFDIVHPGHIHHLEHARSLGDLLIVTVSSDAFVSKGVNRPLIPDDLRARNLAALAAVDIVFVNPHATAVELLEALQPDIYVKGREYETSSDPRFTRERHVVAASGGRVVFSGGDVIYSSTAIIRSFSETDAFEAEKLRRFRDRYDLSPARLNALVHQMSQLKIVVAGDYILDRYHFCEALGVAGEAPVMSLRSVRRNEYDGGAAIVAAHLAGLGVTPTLVTNFADDVTSHAAELRLRSAGIELRGVRTRKQTVCKERYLVESTKMFRVEEGAPTPLDSQAENAFAAALLEAAADADAVIFTDFGFGTLTRGVVERVLPELRNGKRILAADISGNHSSLRHFHGMDLICPTEREARQSVDDFAGGLGAVVASLLNRLSAKQAIITLGKQGLVCFDRPVPASPDGRLRSEYIPALARHGVDPLGCGDALLALATSTLACGVDLAAASLLGAYAAAFEVEQIGNIPLDRDVLLHQINQPLAPALSHRVAS